MPLGKYITLAKCVPFLNFELNRVFVYNLGKNAAYFVVNPVLGETTGRIIK